MQAYSIKEYALKIIWKRKFLDTTYFWNHGAKAWFYNSSDKNGQISYIFHWEVFQ